MYVTCGLAWASLAGAQMAARESPAGKTEAVPLHKALHLFKRQLVVETLASHEGNRTRAAASLMIERTSLLRLIRELGITELPDGHRGRPPSSRKRS